MAKTKASAKVRILTYLNKTPGTTTLSVAEARSRFKIANPTARISELRADGYGIKTEMKTGRDGFDRAVYSLASKRKIKV